MEYSILSLIESRQLPFYLFDEQLFIDNFNKMASVFQSFYPNYRIAYSFKTNYTPYICKLVKDNGGYAEVVSDMEYLLARKLGFENRQIIYNGPYKGVSLDDHLLSGGIINIDNYYECQRVCSIAKSFPHKELKIGLRLNMDLGGGFISRFGMVDGGNDIKNCIELINKHSNLHVVGLHCHIKAPRDPESWKQRSSIMVSAADRYVEGTPEYISLGSGMVPGDYSQYPEDYIHFKPSFSDFAESLFSPIINHYPEYKQPIIFTEPGRSVISRYIRFFSRVDNIKVVRNRFLATMNGSLFNLGEIYSQARIPIIVHHLSEAKHFDSIDIMGYTCLEQDMMFHSYKGRLAVGDIIEFRNVGGYSIVYKPQFCVPQCAMYSLKANGETQMIMRPESFEDIFNKFLFSADSY